MCRLPMDGPKVPLARPAQSRTAQYDDEFLQYSYKVVPCDKTWRHDYASCPFAHAGESSERRHPTAYLPFMCNSTQHSTDLKEKCPFGASCKYAHGHFELWLHPGRFRTKMCSLGGACRRPVCFFAHSEAELRVTPFSRLDSSASVAAQQLAALDGAAPAPSSMRSSCDGSDLCAGRPRAALGGLQQSASSLSSPCSSEAGLSLRDGAKPARDSPCSSVACDDGFAALSAGMVLNAPGGMRDMHGLQQLPGGGGGGVPAGAYAGLGGGADASPLWLGGANGLLPQQLGGGYGGLMAQQGAGAGQQLLLVDNGCMMGGYGAPAPANDLVGAGGWVLAPSSGGMPAGQWATAQLLAQQSAPAPLPFASAGLAARSGAGVQLQCLPVPSLMQAAGGGLDGWLTGLAPPGLGCQQMTKQPQQGSGNMVQLLSALPDGAMQQLLGMLVVDAQGA